MLSVDFRCHMQFNCYLWFFLFPGFWLLCWPVSSQIWPDTQTVAADSVAFKYVTWNPIRYIMRWLCISVLCLNLYCTSFDYFLLIAIFAYQLVRCWMWVIFVKWSGWDGREGGEELVLGWFGVIFIWFLIIYWSHSGGVGVFVEGGRGG